MRGRRTSFRTRLVLSFAAVALGTIVVAGGITLVFARTNARDAAIDDLRGQADALAAVLERGALEPRSQRSLIRSLRLQDATILGITRLGAVGPLPEGIEPGDLDAAAVLAGETVTGQDGSLVYLAQPLQQGPPTRRSRSARPVGRALVLTRDIGGIDLGGLGPWVAGAAGIALVGAVGAGTVLARRLSRPISATAHAARAIAGGDLTARIGASGGDDEELHQLASAFDDMASEIERSRALSRDFLMSVSHDLRTPLTSIRGYAEALSEGAARTKADRQRAAAIIEAESRRLERLVSDLLDLARLDARVFSLESVPTKVPEVVGRVVEGLAPLAREHGVELTADIAEDGLRDVDPERLAQVVANLVENALTYARRKVVVRTRRDRHAAVVEVEDDGPGIPPEERDLVFERLYTAGREGGRSVGTGLGLAIVHELVEAMGGTVDLDEPAGGGAVFRVVLE